MKLKYKIRMVKVSVLILAASALSACEPADPNQTQEQRMALLELDRLAKIDPTFSTLASKFPQDWTIIREQLAVDYANSTSPDEVVQAATQKIREFTGSKSGALAAAPAASLVAMIKADTDVLRALQTEDVTQCAEFSRTGITSLNQVSAATTTLLSISGQKRIQAARDGMDDPQERPVPTREDDEALNQALSAAGVSENYAKGYFDASLPDTDQCALAVTTYSALSSMPEEQAARLFAKIGILHAGNSTQAH